MVQETEYTGAGKHIGPQLSFARENGIDIHFGDPRDEVAGESIILPKDPGLIRAVALDLDRIRISLIKNAIATLDNIDKVSEKDIDFLAEDTGSSVEFVKHSIKTLNK